MAKRREAEDLTAATFLHPGDLLRTAFMVPVGLTAHSLSRALQVTPQRIAEILSGRRGITPETALRLSKLLGTTPQFWLYLQADYDLREAEKKWSKDITAKIKRIDLSDRVDVGSEPGGTCKQGKDRNENRAAPPPDVKLEGDQKVVFELLGPQPTHVEDLIKQSGLAAGNMSAALTMLELSGLISRRAGDRYVRAGSN